MVIGKPLIKLQNGRRPVAHFMGDGSGGQVPAQWKECGIKGDLRLGSRSSGGEDPEEHPNQGRMRAGARKVKGSLRGGREGLMGGNTIVTSVNKATHWEWQWSAIIPGGQAGERRAPNSGGARGAALRQGFDGRLIHQTYR
jgi:hypothetical protein